MTETEEIVPINELPILKENPSQNLQKIADKRRFEILDNIIKKVGFRNARKREKALEEHYKVSLRTIQKDFEWIRGNIKPEDIKEIKVTCKVARDIALDEALERFNEQPTIDNAAKIIEIAKSYRTEVEEWGEKEKIAEKLNLGGELGFYGEFIKAAKGAVGKVVEGKEDEGNSKDAVQH